MITVQVKREAGSLPHLFRVIDSFSYGDEFHFEPTINPRVASFGKTAFVFRPGSGRKPRKGEFINIRKFLGV